MLLSTVPYKCVLGFSQQMVCCTDSDDAKTPLFFGVAFLLPATDSVSNHSYLVGKGAYAAPPSLYPTPAHWHSRGVTLVCHGVGCSLFGGGLRMAQQDTHAHCYI